jgi:3-deoxy-D-manno-octulosonic acid kinase
LKQANISEQFSTLEQGKVSCLFNHTIINDFNAEMLTPIYWQQKNAVTGTAQGRGTTWFVIYCDSENIQHEWVLRHYYRGGLIGKLINDSYWFTGIDKTRAASEFSLLQHMQTLQLPAPNPIAYRVIRCGLTYQADLLSTRIQNAQDLVGILSKQQLSTSLWSTIGATIRKFHDHNIYHHDLNSHNILINTQEQVFLIDFDRGELRKTKESSAWKKANIARLKRSFLKESNKLETFYFNDENWQALMNGYQGIDLT